MKSITKFLGVSLTFGPILKTGLGLIANDYVVGNMPLKPLDPKKLEKINKIAEKMGNTHEIRYGETKQSDGGSYSQSSIFSNKAIVVIDPKDEGLIMSHELAHICLNHTRQRVTAIMISDLFVMGVGIFSSYSLPIIALTKATTSFARLYLNRRQEMEADNMALKFSDHKDVGLAIHEMRQEITYKTRFSEITENSDSTLIKMLGKITVTKDGENRFDIFNFDFDPHPKTGKRINNLLNFYYETIKNEPINIEIDETEHKIHNPNMAYSIIRKMIKESKKSDLLFDTNKISLKTNSHESNIVFQRENNVNLVYDIDNKQLIEYIINHKENPNKSSQLFLNLIQQAIHSKPFIYFKVNDYTEENPDINLLDENMCKENMIKILKKNPYYEMYDINNLKIYKDKNGEWLCKVIKK